MAEQFITFGDKRLSIADIVDIASRKKNVRLSDSDSFGKKIQAGADFLDELLVDDGVIYGVTTGYGDSCTEPVALSLVNELPIHLSRFHGCGLGKHFDQQTTRAILATRLCSLSKGYSGVSYALLERLVLMLNEDVLPLIPEEGSVGASGDLTPSSYIARALIGEADVLFQGELMPSAEAFGKLDVKPYKLRPKEALALMNGTAAMTAVACLNYIRAEYLT